MGKPGKLAWSPLMVWGLQIRPKSWPTVCAFWFNCYLENMLVPVNEFKINLEEFKVSNKVNCNYDNFWDVSVNVLSKIEGPSYLENKAKRNNNLKINPICC